MLPSHSEEPRRAAITRRRFLEGSVLLSSALMIGACGSDETASTGRSEPARPSSAEPAPLAPTPACDDDDDATKPQTEGPFYTPDTPGRTSLLDGGVRGAPLLLTGVVVDTRCRPIGGALLDFWQADGDGRYDNDGYRLRGHQFADARGRFRLRTVVPGLYPGRTRHIHVKVQRPRGEVLTTQLYFPGEPRNRDDAIFDDALLMSVRRSQRGDRARFRFVLS